MRRIEIVPPRQEWAAEFQRLKAALLRAVPEALAIHHIGSTAVPGLPAKDVIDIQVTVATLASIDPEALAAEGFIGDRFIIDHAPPGRDLPEAELAKRFYKGQDRPANVHFRERGRFNQRYAVLCRDFLRTHPTAAGAYALIKQRLAERFPEDVDVYYDIKDPVSDLIVEAAEEWAARTGWTEPPGDGSA